MNLLIFLFISTINGDIYREELVFKRLASGNLLANFRFATTTENLDGHFDLFPKLIGEYIVKYQLNEIHSSLSQGFWRSNLWGLAPQPASSSGAQISVWFDGNPETVNERWTGLVHSLSGFLCASMVQMVPTLTAIPNWAFLPQGLLPSGNFSVKMGRFAQLASENICTENLTPWKKLLPCKQAGLSSLLHPIKFYESQYHSMGISILRQCADGVKKCQIPQWRIVQNLNVVFDVPLRTKILDWNLMSLFASKIHRSCQLAESSKILIENEDKEVKYSPNVDWTLASFDGRKFAIFDLLKIVDFPFQIAAKYADKLMTNENVNLKLIIHSHVEGGGQQNGRIVTRLVNNNSANRMVVFSHVIPWFLRIYYHSLTVDCRHLSDVPLTATYLVSKHFAPSKDRLRPSLMELILSLPADCQCHIGMDFDKSHLRWTEYPPDASKGFFVPAARLTFRLQKGDDMTVSEGFQEDVFLSFNDTSPLVTMYGEALLVALPVPDFSMPYNVICLVCTVVALCFGPVHNLTTKSLVFQFDYDKKPKTLVDKLKALIVKLVDKIQLAYSEWRKKIQERKMND